MPLTDKRSVTIMWRVNNLLPEVIEVVPVVRGVVAIMGYAFHIPMQRSLEKKIVGKCRRVPCINETFEINIVTIVATIQTEHQHNRSFQYGGDMNRSAWKAG